MKTKIKKYGLVVSLVACFVLCTVFGMAFMKDPEASAEEISTYSSSEDVTETIEADTFSEGVTYESDEGVYFEYVSEYGGFSVTGCSDECTDFYIPDTLTISVPGKDYTYPVVYIEEKCTNGKSGVTYIRVGRYVEYVGRAAFYYRTNATAVDYFAQNAKSGANGSTTASNCPFGYTGRDSKHLDLFIGASVEVIPAGMFAQMVFSTITFGEGSQLKEIGASAFYNAMNYGDPIPEIRIPDTVETIGASAFGSFTKEVEAFYLPESLTTVGKCAFELYRANDVYFNTVNFPDCDTDLSPFYYLSYYHYIDNGASGLATIYIGKNVRRIPSYCFCANKTKCSVYVEKVVLASKDDGGYALESIGDHAFYKCEYLTSVTLPTGLEKIEPYAFDGCSKLTSVTLGDTDGWYVTEEDGTKPDGSVQYYFGEEFMSDSSTVAKYLRTTYTSYVFNYTDGFTYELSEDGTYYIVTGYVGDGGEVTLTEKHRAKSVKEVGESAFKGDTTITSVVIPESIVTIDSEAFYGCTKLASVTIKGSGLEKVEADAFSGCSALKSLYVSSASAFVSVDYDGRYANPLAVVSSNKGKFYVGGDSYTSLSINGTDGIGTYALAYCTIITSVTIGDGVEKIGSYAFYGNTAISSMAIPSSVAYIGENAFSSMSLDRVTFASPSGWTVSDGKTEIKLAGSELQTYATEYLTTTYSSYVWTRNVTDHAQPTIECATENGGYTNGPITLTTTVDSGCSIWYISYTDPEGNTFFVYDHTLTLTADGTGTLSEPLMNGLYAFVAADTEGLVSEPYYITYDDTAPDLYVGGMAAWVNYSDKEFSVMAYDSSPVTLYASRDGGATWTVCSSNPYTVYPEESYATDGEYWFKAVDAAGNVTGPYYTVLDTMEVYGEWETGDDNYPYFSFEAPSYTEWSCTMNGEPYASGTKLRTCQTTYYVSLVGKNGSTLTTDYTLNHFYPEEGVYTEPTCSSYGYTTYSCIYCGESYIVVDLYSTSASHNYEEHRVEPSCTDKGSYWYVCTECGDSTTPVEIDALGHAPVADQMIAATCTTEGYTGKVCSRCGVLLEGEIIPATGHSYYTVPVPATCTEPAKNVYTCSVCGDTFEAYTDTALAEHTWGAWDHVSPTCTEEGYESRCCEVCGAEDPDSGSIPATRHSYITAVWHEWTDEETGKIYRYRYCDNCGEVDWYDADDPTEVASNGVTDLFKKYQQYMWWILLAFVAVWSIIIGLRWALARNSEEKAKSHSMLANYIIGLFVIAIILVGLPYLIYGIALLV